LLLYFLPSTGLVTYAWESITGFKVIWSAERNPRHKILNSYSRESEITTVGNVEQIGLYGFSFVIWIWTFLRAHMRTTTHRLSLLLSTYCPHWTTERTQWCSSGAATECGIPLRCGLMFHAFIMGYIIGKSGWPLWLVLRTHLTIWRTKLCNLSFSVKISDSIPNWGNICPNILPHFFKKN